MERGASPTGIDSCSETGDCRGIWVFAYGSLVDRTSLQETLQRSIPLHEVRYCSLRGYRRVWNAAMDNRKTLPGYKYYLDRDGRRPDVRVTFVNIRPALPAEEVNGIAFRVEEAEFARLEERERNYHWQRIGGLLEPDITARDVRVFTAREEAVRRFTEAEKAGKAVICRDYFNDIVAAFRSPGCPPDWWERYQRSTDDCKLPVLDLFRVEIPRW